MALRLRRDRICMDQASHSPFGAEHEAVTPERARHCLLRVFSHSCAIGFAILDNHLRYEAINNRLAVIHGIPARAHLGHTVREVLGDVGAKTAPRYHRVLANGERVCFAITNAVLPRTLQGAYSVLKTCFPIQDRAGKVHEVGIMVVDMGDQRRLEKLLYEVAAQVRDAESREQFWLARELHDSIEQYHSALALSLDLVIRDREKSTEALAQSVEALDHRIMTMNTLVSSVARRFAIHK